MFFLNHFWQNKNGPFLSWQSLPVKVSFTWVFTTYHDPQPLCHFSPKVMAATTYLKQFPISWLLVFKRAQGKCCPILSPRVVACDFQVWAQMYKHLTCPRLEGRTWSTSWFMERHHQFPLMFQSKDRSSCSLNVTATSVNVRDKLELAEFQVRK